MPETDISKAVTGNVAGTETIFSVPSVQTDAPQEQKETKWRNTRWSQQLGYYKSIKTPKLSGAIDAQVRWTIGRGFKSNEITEMLLMGIKGNGKDTFNIILENMIRVKLIGGDSFAEIIRDDEGVLINVKPLDPGTIDIIANKKGIIIRYEQTSKAKTKKAPRKFEPDQIFHLSRNRTADEIHGLSLVDTVEGIILALGEAMADYRKLLHRNVCPVRLWKVDTDDATKIAAIKRTIAESKGNFEDIIIPKGTVETEIAAVPSNATLNPLPQINFLNDHFYQTIGVPQSVIGGSKGFTEAAEKIHYLAFEQTVAEEQLDTEEQVLSQLNLEIELEFPTSLMNEMLSSQTKSETMQASTPEDTSVQNIGVK